MLLPGVKEVMARCGASLSGQISIERKSAIVAASQPEHGRPTGPTGRFVLGPRRNLPPRSGHHTASRRPYSGRSIAAGHGNGRPADGTAARRSLRLRATVRQLVTRRCAARRPDRFTRRRSALRASAPDLAGVGLVHGITPEQVRQIQNQVILRLRHHTRRNKAVAAISDEPPLRALITAERGPNRLKHQMWGSKRG
jgi:hypothetical protein